MNHVLKNLCFKLTKPILVGTFGKILFDLNRLTFDGWILLDLCYIKRYNFYFVFVQLEHQGFVIELYWTLFSINLFEPWMRLREF